MTAPYCLRPNQTETEHRLWTQLRARQLCDAEFRRQHPIGPFIVDSYYSEHRLVVELDDGQHAAHAEVHTGDRAILQQQPPEVQQEMVKHIKFGG